MMARPMKPRKNTKEEMTIAGKEVKAERRRSPKKIQNVDGNMKRENGNMEMEVFSKKEIGEIIASQQRLREELESKRLEISALRQLVDTLVDGAVPLSVPVEVFYNIGQQYLEKNAHAFSLQFPPLKEILAKTENTPGDSSDVEAVELRGEKEGEEGGFEEEGSLDGLEGLNDLEEVGEPIEDVEEKRDNTVVKEELLPKSIAERKTKSLFALKAWQREEGLEATFNGLVEELELKGEMNEALLQQNEVMQKQNQVLNEQIKRWDAEFSNVEGRYQELQDKVNCITKQAEELLSSYKEMSKLDIEKQEVRRREEKSRPRITPTANGTLAGNPNRVIPVLLTPDYNKQREARVLRPPRVMGVEELFPPVTKPQVVANASPQIGWEYTAAPHYFNPLEQAHLTHTSVFPNRQAQTIVANGKLPTPFSFRPRDSPSRPPAVRR